MARGVRPKWRSVEPEQARLEVARHYLAAYSPATAEDFGRWFIGVQAFSVGGAFLRGRNYAALARPIAGRPSRLSGRKPVQVSRIGESARPGTGLESLGEKSTNRS